VKLQTICGPKEGSLVEETGLGEKSMIEVGQEKEIPTHLTLLSNATPLIGINALQLLSQVRLARKWGVN